MMFDFKRKSKVWSTCNTDIGYLENKDKQFEELKGLRDRINKCLCELDESFKYQHMNLINYKNVPFVPKDVNNYSKEVNEHYRLIRALEKNFDELFIKTIDVILQGNNTSSRVLKSAFDIENIKIRECKNKYPEAKNLILLVVGEDVLQAQELIENAIALFHSSMEYIEVLQRSKTEGIIKR